MSNTVTAHHPAEHIRNFEQKLFLDHTGHPVHMVLNVHNDKCKITKVTFFPPKAPLPALGKSKLGSAGGSKKGLPPLKRSLPAPPQGGKPDIPQQHQQSLGVPETVGGAMSPTNLSRESSPLPQRRQWGDAKPLSLGMAGKVQTCNQTTL